MGAAENASTVRPADAGKSGPAAAGNGKLLLLPQHLADLRRSGLSDDQIAACHFYSVSDPVRITQLLGWEQPVQALGACLAIPFTDAESRPAEHVRGCWVLDRLLGKS
jgi:hypothetical protein